MVGINAVTLRLADVRTRQYDAIRNAGFRAIRLHVEWPLIEPAPGRYIWGATDALIDNAVQRGIEVLGVVTYTPSWAATAEGRGFLHPHPASAAQFAEFIRLAAERYRGKIRYWEIWNEPNVVTHWAPRPDVPLYVAMLKAAYTELKAVDPGNFVVTGGTSPTVDADDKMSPVTFVSKLYEHGGGDYFDALGMHPYSTPNLLSSASAEWSSNSDIRNVSAVMRRNGQGDKKIWFTEFGAPTMTGHEFGVSEARQAEILTDAIKFTRTMPNGGPIFIFDHRDIETGSANAEMSYGLLRTDWSAKPGFEAVRSLISGAGS